MRRLTPIFILTLASAASLAKAQPADQALQRVQAPGAEALLIMSHAVPSAVFLPKTPGLPGQPPPPVDPRLAVWERIGERARITTLADAPNDENLRVAAHLNGHPFEISATGVNDLDTACVVGLQQASLGQIHSIRLERGVPNHPLSHLSSRAGFSNMQTCSILILNQSQRDAAAPTPTFSGAFNGISFRIQAHAREALSLLNRHLPRIMRRGHIHTLNLQGERLRLARPLTAAQTVSRLRQGINAMGGPRVPTPRYSVSGTIEGTPFSFEGSVHSIFASCMRFVGSEVFGPIHRAQVGRRPFAASEALSANQVCAFVVGGSPS